MIKFNLMRPDDDFPDGDPELEQEEISEDPVEEEITDKADEGLDETILNELDEYKRSQPEISEEPAEDEEQPDEDEKKSLSIGIITLISTVAVLLIFFLSYYFEILPSAMNDRVDDLKESIVMMISGEKAPEPAIAEERFYEEVADTIINQPDTLILTEKSADTLVITPVVIEEKEEPAIQSNEEEVLEDLEQVEKFAGNVSASDYKKLTMESAHSQALIDHHLAFIRLFPKGLFISTLTTSASDLVLEAKATNKSVFIEFKDKVDNSALFNNFSYILDSSPDFGNKEAIFRGAYTLRFDNRNIELYNLSSERFIRALANIANREKMSFTEMRHFEVENEFTNVKTTMHRIAFYGNIDKIVNFMTSMKELPATYSLEKIYLSRKSTDSFPIPIKIFLYISLHERGE